MADSQSIKRINEAVLDDFRVANGKECLVIIRIIDGIRIVFVSCGIIIFEGIGIRLS
jgi:hypothetical protein